MHSRDRADSDYVLYVAVDHRYDILEFNVPLDTVYIISVMLILVLVLVLVGPVFYKSYSLI